VGMMQEFKDFAMKGNVVDMAVGVVVGGAFGKLVTSFTNDVLMPPIGLMTGGIDFADLNISLTEATEAAEAVAINYGIFINTVIDFVIIAVAIFLVVKAMNAAQREEEEAPAEPPPTPEDITLLREIRDSLNR
jgi:large conductance mechanosensitive channel